MRGGVTPLMIACSKGSASVVRLLLESGADASRQSSQGWNAIYIGAKSGGVEVVLVLVEVGGKGWSIMEQRCKGGRNGLFGAVRGGDVYVVRMLVRGCVSLTDVDDGGRSILHEAADVGSFECLNVLLEAMRMQCIAGEGVRKKDNAGFTPLHCAAVSGDYDKILEVLTNGAPIGISQIQV